MSRRQFLFLLGTACIPPAAALATSEDQKVRCVRLAGRIAELRLRLRMGYTARQGRLYRQKLAALEAEYRAACD